LDRIRPKKQWRKIRNDKRKTTKENRRHGQCVGWLAPSALCRSRKGGKPAKKGEGGKKREKKDAKETGEAVDERNTTRLLERNSALSRHKTNAKRKKSGSNFKKMEGKPQNYENFLAGSSG